MNDKLKELWEQCREEYQDTEWPDSTCYRFDDEKFARLIIEECGKIADNYRDEHLRSFPSDAMKKHFGVKE